MKDRPQPSVFHAKILSSASDEKQKNYSGFRQTDFIFSSGVRFLMRFSKRDAGAIMKTNKYERGRDRGEGKKRKPRTGKNIMA